jgi:type II secretory pathway pseudopilin PulG
MKAVKKHSRREGGYALVSILAVMAVMALALLAAAPNLKKQQQRDMELEAISRGEHLAEAIGDFINCRRRPPTSLEELMKEGCPAQGSVTKRRYLMRASALKDPLFRSEDDDDKEGNWRLIAPQSRPVVSFSRAIAEFAGGQTPRHNRYPIMQQFAPVTVQTVRGLDGDKDTKDDDNSGLSGDYKGPFIGVASRSQRDAIITYYGIEQHSRWIFTPAYR